MRILINFALLLFLVSFCSVGYSQQKSKTEITHPITEKLYAYSFQGALPEDILEKLSLDIQKMLFVSKVKIEYKVGKQMGQVRVWTKEYFTSKDTDFQFNILGLDELLVKYNLKPIKYTADLINK